MSVIATNPILAGFYPDPSMCAVGEDFYLVNSTFAYFPGLPVMHSKDLANWEQIGNAMERESQLHLDNAGHSQGLFAPTIRYNNGTFYIICTNVTYGGNYIIKADKPEGPWSEPYYIKGADGIDPSLYFDDDGKCYYIGTHPNPDGVRYNGDYFIWIQELDIEKMELVGEPHNVWNGAMRNICWPEGPHLYKRGDYYYIMHAEGGTGPEHAVTVCRSKNVYGPYENNFCNPILTHRHLGVDYPIKYVGHADLVETVNGEWYICMLAVRPQERFTTMGRETFLAKVTWENDWPVVNPGVGMLTPTVEIDLPSWESEIGDRKISDEQQFDFKSMEETLPFEWMSLRKAPDRVYEIEKGVGLKLNCSKVTLKEKATPSYLSIRQRHHNFEAKTVLDMTTLDDDNKAGIAYVQSDEYHLRVELSNNDINVILCQQKNDTVVANAKLDNLSKATVGIKVLGLGAKIFVSDENGNIIFESESVDIRALSTEVAGGFVGCTVGIYAVNLNNENETKAVFERFEYIGR